MAPPPTPTTPTSYADHDNYADHAEQVDCTLVLSFELRDFEVRYRRPSIEYITAVDDGLQNGSITTSRAGQQHFPTVSIEAKLITTGEQYIMVSVPHSKVLMCIITSRRLTQLLKMMALTLSKQTSPHIWTHFPLDQPRPRL